MKLIPLTKGKFAQVDDEDFEKVNQFKWCVQKIKNLWYASRNISIEGKQKKVLMHRDVMNISDSSLFIDHIDHDGLNNQKINLRQCSQRENLYNKKGNKDTVSQYKGVTFFNKKWVARINKDGKRYFLGGHLTEIEAAKAYDVKAKELYGTFAHLNFP